MALNKHVKAARNSVLETIKIQKKLEDPVQPTYSHEDAVARAYMASNLIANIFLGNEGGDDQVKTKQRTSFYPPNQTVLLVGHPHNTKVS